MEGESWLDAFRTYKSVKFVRVTNTTLAVTYYSLMLLVVIYVIAFSMVANKGYQKFTIPVGTVSPKIKGTGIVRPEGGKELYEGTIWTAEDMVMASEANAAFIATRYLITQQNRGICPMETGKDHDCSQDSECAANEVDAEFGVYTGTCNTTSSGGTGSCNLAGWCPLENDHVGVQDLDYVGNWTIFFKVNIRFPDFDIDKTNAEDQDGNGVPKDGYNLFTLNEILEMAGQKLSAGSKKGAIILFTTKFECNLDKSKNDQCEPEYTAHRIDNVEGTISPGFNYRSVYYSDEFGSRDLWKKYGVRIIFVIDGHGGKFDWIQTAVTIGAGIGFFGIATLITDLVMDSFVDKADKYSGMKYEDINSDIEKTPSLSRRHRPSDALIANGHGTSNEISPI